MNKLSVKFIRAWITLSFIFTFGLGWVALSHAEKPAALTPFQTTSIVSGIEFTSIPKLEELTTNNRNSTSSASVTFTRTMPRLRTMGS